jgi:hypothetical protein
MYPKNSIGCKHTNINLKLDGIGQALNENGQTYVDEVSAVQFNIHSHAKINRGYRQEI